MEELRLKPHWQCAVHTFSLGLFFNFPFSWMMGKLFLKTPSSSTARTIHQLELLCFFTLVSVAPPWDELTLSVSNTNAELGLWALHWVALRLRLPQMGNTGSLGSRALNNNTFHLNDQSQTWGGLAWVCPQEQCRHSFMWKPAALPLPSNSTESIKCLWPRVTFRLSFTPLLCQMPLSPFLIPCIYVTAAVKQECIRGWRLWPLPMQKVHTNVKPMTCFLLRVAACLNRSKCWQEAHWMPQRAKKRAGMRVKISNKLLSQIATFWKSLYLEPGIGQRRWWPWLCEICSLTSLWHACKTKKYLLWLRCFHC